MMKWNQYLKLVMGIFVLGLVLIACEDFADETFNLTVVDEQGVASIGDTLSNNLPFAAGDHWIVNYTKSLALDSLLQTYYHVLYDSTSDTVSVDSITLTIDTTYSFAFEESIDFYDTLTVNTINGNDTILYFDTSFVHIDTVTANVDTIRYSAEHIFENDYPLPYILLRWGNGAKDTVYAAEMSQSREMIELYTAMNTLNTSIGVNDTSYVANLPNDSTSYCLLSATTAGTYVIYLNHHAQPSIFADNSGSMLRVDLASDDMSPELVASLYSLPGPVPTIKGRYEFKLDAGTYLFELARMEATTLDDFRVVLMREQ